MLSPTYNEVSCRVATVLLFLTSGAVAQEAVPEASPQAAAVVRIGLPDAQARAVLASKAKELAALNLKAAKEHRQAVQADYFPKISSTFLNLQFNKFMGYQISVFSRSRGLPLLTEDSTTVAVTVTQPVTPLFQVHEAVRIDRADEHIARARIDAAAAQVTAAVERTYFGLLIAQAQQRAAQIKLRMLERPKPMTSVSAIAQPAPAPVQAELVTAAKALETASGQVAELTQSLDALMGLPDGTQLDLTPPPSIVEKVSTGDPPARAVDTNPEVVEAQQTLEQARAAAKLAKLDYMPVVAGTWGFIYTNATPLLPRDFSYVGFVASWNVFDFGKREHTLSERNTQVNMAETNLALVRAKVAAGIQKTSLDLQRSRRIVELTRLYQGNAARYRTVSLEDQAAQAQAELEMLQAELDYRLAFAEAQRALGVE